MTSCIFCQILDGELPASMVYQDQHVPHVHLHVLSRKGGDLAPALLSLGSRLLNRFGEAARPRRLDQIACELAEHMPARAESALTQRQACVVSGA